MNWGGGGLEHPVHHKWQAEVQKGHVGTRGRPSLPPLGPVRRGWSGLNIGMGKQGPDLPGLPLFLGPRKAEPVSEPSLYPFLQ